MRFLDDQLVFSPSDLITFMESPYASWMERKKLEDPSISELMDGTNALLTTLQEMGYAHDDAYTESLRNEGADVLEIERANPDRMAGLTLEAMQAGRDIIVQGYLSHGRFAGMADYLKKVPGRSDFGDYHYEIWDTKLSRKLKPYFAIQLCCYAEMLEALQGMRPQSFAVVPGDQARERLRVDDYFSYYRFLKASFLARQDAFDPSQEPDPAESRAHGRWSDLAKTRLEEGDHLSQVANITRLQIRRLEDAGIDSMQKLADSALENVPMVGEAIFSKLKAQAAIQISSRGKDKPDYKILTHQDGTEGEEAKGLALLPPHSDLDIFFDIEGYPLVDGGLEYLWGCTYFDAEGKRRFRDFWAHDPLQEKRALTDFIDWAYERWQSYPTMHVYHYASYEITAMRKLMGRYGVREGKIDNLLRNNVFVDLYKVVRHGLLIGEPRYSIKNVEHIYRGRRDTDVAGGDDSIVVYEAWRSNPDGETWETSEILNSIRDYNIDDCDSTQELARWLRNEQTDHGIAFSGPTGEGEIENPEEVTELTKLRDVLQSRACNTTDQNRSRLLETLAWALDFHTREEKPTWWRYYDRLGLSEPELHDDMECLAGLTRTDREPYLNSPRDRNKVYEYAFDTDQPFKGKDRKFSVLGVESLNTECKDYDSDSGLIGFKHREALPERMSVIPYNDISQKIISTAVFSVAKGFADGDFPGGGVSDFLLRSRPRITGNERGPILKGREDRLDEVISAAVNLDNSYLCIQGPPGTGKTYTGGHIIAELLSRGKRVGITSNSHDAILNLEHVQS